MKMVLTIEMDNDAYVVDPECKARNGAEISRQLRELARKIDNSLLFAGDVFHIPDINGSYTLVASVED